MHCASNKPPYFSFHSIYLFNSLITIKNTSKFILIFYFYLLY